MGKDKPVRCIETNIVYPSLTTAGNELGIVRQSISKACCNKSKTAAGYHWEYVETKKNGTESERCRLKSIRDSMIQRCENPKRPNYAQYGGRGIKVCKEWRNDYELFVEWALSNGYKSNLTLDRIDNNGNYEPNNCRWADADTQANNTNRNVFIEVNGISKTAAQWGKYLGISSYTVYDWVREHGKEYAQKRILDTIKYGKGYIQCTMCGEYYEGKNNGYNNHYCKNCRSIALKEYYKEYNRNRRNRKSD